MKQLTDFFSHLLKQIQEIETFETAAALAFYALFSLFPLIMITIAIASPFLTAESLQEQLIQFSDQFLPGGRELLITNLNQLFNFRGSMGLVGVIGLIWSASSFFAGMALNINQIWHRTNQRGFWLERLISIAMIISLLLVLVVSVVFSAALSLLPGLLQKLNWGDVTNWSAMRTTFLQVFSLTVKFFLFAFLYKWLPNTMVLWKEAFLGSLVSTILWASSQALFIWFLHSNLNTYHIIYGSLGSVLAFLFWLYIGMVVILVGAHISEAYARVTRLRVPETPPLPGT